MEEPILGKPSLKSLLRKFSGIKKQLQYKIRIHLPRLSLWRTQTSKNVGYIKIIVKNGPESQGLRNLRETSRLTSQERSRKTKDPPGPQRTKGMQQVCKPHKTMQSFSPRCSRTKPWILTQANSNSVGMLTKTI